MSLPVLLCPITVACKTLDNVVGSDQRSSAANEPLIPAAGKPSAAALPASWEEDTAARMY